MSTAKQQGNEAEQHALDYLQAAGLNLLERNFHSRAGEIDLIMTEQTSLVFVEVRYRKSAKFGSALESVNVQKQQRIIKTAQRYLQQNKTDYGNYRFDVVAISPGTDTKTGKNEITWLKDAFQLN